jgi:lipoyl-dependent peroxiredoxin
MGLVRQNAKIVWEGSIARGEGRITGASGGLAEVPFTVPARLEELLAAAQAGCFTMALGSLLARGRTPPERFEVEAVCTLDDTEGQRRIVSINLDVRASVPGADAEAFMRAVAEAERNCVVSRALRGNVEISASARLE